MTSIRGWRRRLALGLPTVLGLPPRGFFIPYGRARDISAAGRSEPYGAIDALFASRKEEFVRWLSILDEYAFELQRLGTEPPPEPTWTQDWFPRLDAAMAYTIVCKLRPKRIVEVGSGHSTRFLARAVADSDLTTSITAIDPAPRADLEGLKGVRLVRKPLHETSLEPFSALTEGDILAIDSSHVLMPGSDVDVLQNRILPELPAGVVVQLHDIFLPDDYPAAWQWRGYNEQLGIALLLQGSKCWDPMFASHYAVTRMSESIKASIISNLPRKEGAHESALWIKKLSHHKLHENSNSNIL